MKSYRGLLCCAVLLFPSAGSAADICKAIALRDVGALESPASVLERGSYDDAITQYRINKRTGVDSFCSHGGYCYPAHVQINGQKVEALRLVNRTTHRPYGLWILSAPAALADGNGDAIMKFHTLLLAVPLTLGYGVAMAQMSTTTETTTTQPVMPSQTTTTKSERTVTPGGALVERNKTVQENADGSTTIDRSKTVTRP
jgi:hypothetical protein